MPSKEMEFTTGGYYFLKRNNRIIVKSRGKKDDREINLIAELEMKYYLNTRKGGIIRKGGWQWCLNSDECRMAVYTPICEIEVTKGKIFCSHSCRNKILGTKKPKNTLKIKLLGTKAPTVVEKRQQADRQLDLIQPIQVPFQPVQVQQKIKYENIPIKEIPTVAPKQNESLVKPEQKPRNNENPGINKGFKCSACSAVLEEIYGSPGRCPICKGDAIFMVVELSSKPKA